MIPVTDPEPQPREAEAPNVSLLAPVNVHAHIPPTERSKHPTSGADKRFLHQRAVVMHHLVESDTGRLPKSFEYLFSLASRPEGGFEADAADLSTICRETDGVVEVNHQMTGREAGKMFWSEFRVISPLRNRYP